MPFEALEVALALDAAIQPALELIAKRNPRLADQGSRASESNVLALSEGGSRINRGQMQFWRTALGSVTELRDVVRLAIGRRYITAADLGPAAELLDRSRAIDWRL